MNASMIPSADTVRSILCSRQPMHLALRPAIGSFCGPGENSRLQQLGVEDSSEIILILSMNTCQRVLYSRVKLKVVYSAQLFVSVSCAHSTHSARLVSTSAFTRMGAAAEPGAGEADRGAGTASLRVHG